MQREGKPSPAYPNAGPRQDAVRTRAAPAPIVRVIIDGDDEAEAKAKALAEHVARHPEDVGRTVASLLWARISVHARLDPPLRR